MTFAALSYRFGLPIGWFLVLFMLAWHPFSMALAAEMAGTVPLRQGIVAPTAQQRVTVDVEDMDVRQVLMELAASARLNLVLDPWTEGTITLSLTNVPVGEAIEAIATMANLDIVPQGRQVYLVVPHQKAIEKGLVRQQTEVIPVRYANAVRLARVLNQTIFAEVAAANTTGAAPNASAAPANGGQQTARHAMADLRTNSVIVTGTPVKLAAARDLLTQMDQPRESRTYQLSYANAVNVAMQLNSSVFNDGVNPIQPMGGGGSGGGGGAGGGAGGGGGGAGGGAGGQQSQVMPSPVRVTQEFVEEGTGINFLGGGSSSSSSSESGETGTSGAALMEGVAIRATVKADSMLQVSPEGPLLVPDTRQNTLTILGTPQQLAMAEKVIPIFDARPPQVAIEASLVELSQAAQKELGASFAADMGQFSWSFNNLSALGGALLGGGVATEAAAFGFRDNQNLQDLFSVRLTALIEEGKAKNLANPTVVATHDTETIISIVDEIRRGQGFNTQSTSAAGGGFASTVPIIGQAGIILDIVPKVGEDDTVTLRVRPSVSSVFDTQIVAGSPIQLLRRRDLIAQSVRVKDGETLVIGGLIDNRDTRITTKVPLLGDLPIVGALLRSTSQANNRSELVVLLTPHILNKAEPTPVHILEAKPVAATPGAH